MDPRQPLTHSARGRPARLSRTGRRLIDRMLDGDEAFVRRLKADPRTNAVAERLLQNYRAELLDRLQRCLDESAADAAAPRPQPDDRLEGRPGPAACGVSPVRPFDRHDPDGAKVPAHLDGLDGRRADRSPHATPVASLSPSTVRDAAPPGRPPCATARASDDLPPRRRGRVRTLRDAFQHRSRFEGTSRRLRWLHRLAPWGVAAVCVGFIAAALIARTP